MDSKIEQIESAKTGDPLAGKTKAFKIALDAVERAGRRATGSANLEASQAGGRE